jgi:small subunit ribosomal protein S16|tara:strand:+ start:353 stop:592 length:240 start_codon:yes stop_codon:yes gene_type:complete
MLKLRLKKCGRKGQASYRIVAMPSATKRDGKAVEELGFYNPHSNEANINVVRVKARLAQGAQPTETVKNLLKKAAIVAN